MARKQKPKPSISEVLGMNWQEMDPEEPDIYETCNFCQADIKVTEKYFHGYAPDHSPSAGDLVFVACTRCIESAGIKW